MLLEICIAQPYLKPHHITRQRNEINSLQKKPRLIYCRCIYYYFIFTFTPCIITSLEGNRQFKAIINFPS